MKNDLLPLLERISKASGDICIHGGEAFLECRPLAMREVGPLVPEFRAHSAEFSLYSVLMTTSSIHSSLQTGCICKSNNRPAVTAANQSQLQAEARNRFAARSATICASRQTSSGSNSSLPAPCR